MRLSQALQSALATADCGGDEDFRVAYTPLAEHLVNPSFIEHASKDIRILVACCIADLFRLFAPDSPYGDPEQLKVRARPPVGVCSLADGARVPHSTIARTGQSKRCELQQLLLLTRGGLVVMCRVRVLMCRT